MKTSRPPAPPNSADVLIVDDDPDCSETLRHLLEDRGYHVDVAQNGQQALEHFQSGGRPCIVILDLLMPVMGGMEFLSRRQRDPVLSGTPVIVVTATDNRLESPDQVVLQKPVDFALLVEKIEGARRPAA